VKIIPAEMVGRREGKPPFGLSFVPTLEPHFRDGRETLPNFMDYRPGADDNTGEVLDLVAGLSKGRMAALEIGVALYAPEKTMTLRVIENKHPKGLYLGVDLEYRHLADNVDAGAHMLVANSFDQGRVRGKLRELGLARLDLLIIDGCHSVAAAVNDWHYADLLVPGGVVVIHDTNSHPGPVALVEAIDRGAFDVEEPLLGKKDYGLAVCRRKGVVA
jgi:hypothetical protein